MSHMTGDKVYLKPYSCILHNRDFNSGRRDNYIDHFQNDKIITISAANESVFNSNNFDNRNYNYNLTVIDSNRKIPHSHPEIDYMDYTFPF